MTSRKVIFYSYILCCLFIVQLIDSNAQKSSAEVSNEGKEIYQQIPYWRTCFLLILLHHNTI